MFESVDTRADRSRLGWYTTSSPCELKVDKLGNDKQAMADSSL